MRVVVVDDEPIMLLTMKRMLAAVESVELLGSFQNADEAFSFLAANGADLLFLDIQIAADDGIELARKLREHHIEADIVFTTSHAEYAIKAYDVYPLDYMVKPISKNRLLQTIERAAGKRRNAVLQTPSISMRRLKVKMFGCFEVICADGGNVKWISKKSEELFAFLLIQRGKSVSKMTIIDQVFPEMPLKNAETYLNTAVYQLRKALGAYGCKEIVESGQEKYRLDLRRLDVDFLQFEQGIELLAAIHADNEAVAVELEKQMTGELLANCPYAWASAEREALAMLYTSFANRLAERLFQQGDYAEALRIGKRIIAVDLFNEQANELLIRVYAAAGNQRALLQAYEDYAAMMKQELQLPPSDEMMRLIEKYR